MWEKILNIFNYIGDNSGCHQRPDRSFTVNGYTFPLCARCTGVMLGQLGGVFIRLAGVRPRVYILVLMLGLMGLDWGIQYVGIKESTNSRRFLTGIMGGYSVVNLMITGLVWIVKLFI